MVSNVWFQVLGEITAVVNAILTMFCFPQCCHCKIRIHWKKCVGGSQNWIHVNWKRGPCEDPVKKKNVFMAALMAPNHLRDTVKHKKLNFQVTLQCLCVNYSFISCYRQKICRCLMHIFTPNPFQEMRKYFWWLSWNHGQLHECIQSNAI